MYTLKVSYGYVDEPEMATTELLGTYKSRDEASQAAQEKFNAINDGRCGDLEIRYGELESSHDNYYVTYGYFAGYTRYYYISVIER